MNQHNQFNPDYVVTVGEILKEEYLEPLGLSVEEFASRIRITVNLANKILNGEEPINLNLAARLGKLLDEFANDRRISPVIARSGFPRGDGFYQTVG